LAAKVMSGLELKWVGKEEAAKEASSSTLRNFIRQDSRKKFEFTPSLSSHHCIIGDNLEVLKVLNRSSLPFVDLIYIDPPYNTGHDFIYSDTAQPTSNPEAYQGLSRRERSHCAWLSMMYSRLFSAKQLLTESGSIWISIDDNELPHLLLLMNELFGEENHIGTLITSLNPKGRQLGRFATCHEYLVVYAFDATRCKLRFATEDAVNPNDFPHQNHIGYFRFLPLRNSNKRFNPSTRPTLYYPLYIDPKNGDVFTEKKDDRIEVYPVFGSRQPAVWRWSKRKVDQHSAELYGTIVKGRLGDRWDIKQRDYLTKERTKKLKSIWTSDEVGSTDEASREVKNLEVALFDTPKPTRLIRRILSLAPKDSIILDFFAGSGTTGDAVLRQNIADDGQRKFILVQSPVITGNEALPTIATITQSRIKKVIELLNINETVHDLCLD
jgi:adenine-specific DNA-methyltransferase